MRGVVRIIPCGVLEQWFIVSRIGIVLMVVVTPVHRVDGRMPSSPVRGLLKVDGCCGVSRLSSPQVMEPCGTFTVGSGDGTVCNMQISSCGTWEFLAHCGYRCGDGGVRESTDLTLMTRTYTSEMV